MNKNQAHHILLKGKSVMENNNQDFEVNKDYDNDDIEVPTFSSQLYVRYLMLKSKFIVWLKNFPLYETKRNFRKKYLLFKFMLKYFFVPEGKNGKRVKSYFYNDTESYSYPLVFLHTSTKKNQIIITIVLDRPGIFIGRRGDNINRIEKDLSQLLGKPVKFNIIEHEVY